MATPHTTHLAGRLHLPRRTRTADGHAVAVSTAAFRDAAVAGLRIVLGFVFLWAFLDKAFGLGYATRAGQGWIDGGSPTKGFLSHVDAGPMASTLRGWAGETWADWLFMAGLLGIGAALILGIGLRIAAVSGTAMMALMWVAEWPPAKHTGKGTLTASTNPFADYHLVYALALVSLAAVAAGSRYGLGAWWARQPLVRRNGWLR